jgi:hypothetical protein
VGTEEGRGLPSSQKVTKNFQNSAVSTVGSQLTDVGRGEAGV